MEIYVVRTGDSLWSIARRYDTSVAELAYVNQLSDPSRIVPGLALLIPSPGTPNRGSIEVNSYAYPNISDTVLRETLPYLTFFCPFSYHMTAEGDLVPLQDERLIDASYEGGTAPFLTITNIGEEGGFSSAIAHSIFTQQGPQDALLENMLAVLRQKQYYGVNFNIEYVYPFDRESYNQFLRRAADILHPLGYYLSTAIAPKESDQQQGLLYSAHDYAAHGMTADRVILMTYEWGYTYSAPQAVSPVNRIRKVLDYAVTKMPAGKILLGFSNYGYNWTLPWVQGKAASVVSNAAAANLAISSGSEIMFDAQAQAPWFRYTDASGNRHELWFEDVRSVRARLELVREYGLAGISYWTVNQLYRAGLLALGSMYSVEKVV